jgi:subtilisin family serine protease
MRDEAATREVVAIQPAAGSTLAPEQLDTTRGDVRIIGTDPKTGVVLLDAPSPKLEHLREKIEAFGDDAKAITKTDPTTGKITSTKRASEQAVAPIESVRLADVTDRAGPQLRSEPLVDNRAYWFEVACRGGYRRPLEETELSRAQITRQLYRITRSVQAVDEFIAPELVYFFLRLTTAQLQALTAATDCVYELELSPPELRDLRLFDDVTTAELRTFDLQPPPVEAPSVVVLDTGISTGHPLLASAILSATTAGPEIPSPEDTYGHGTKMAGMALYRDLGAVIEDGRAVAPHWIQSSRLLVSPGKGTAADENYEKWPVLTLGAVQSAENADPRARRNRVFALAVTRTMQEPPLDELAAPTLWSHAVDQIAFYNGLGRLLVVSAGNARDRQWLALAEQHPQLQLSEKLHQPAQAANVLTVGAFTERVRLPTHPGYAEARIVAPIAGGVSPYTSTGVPTSDWPVKPDVVFEGGNLALLPGPLPDATVPTLSALTTSHRHNAGQPLGLISMTSEATARAARLAAEVWAVEPRLRPESVRGLLVHAASWTPQMQRQFTSVSDRLAACGYGVPDESLARECAQHRATVVVEGEMPNSVFEEVPKKKPPKRATTKTTVPRRVRKAMLYRLPIPNELLADDDPDVELRVTLSYFAEPNKYHRRVFHGLDLKWDMQGPQETRPSFWNASMSCADRRGPTASASAPRRPRASNGTSASNGGVAVPCRVIAGAARCRSSSGTSCSRSCLSSDGGRTATSCGCSGCASL